jgi:FkbM family methyltransferase
MHQTRRLTASPLRFKDRFWVKTLKWLVYKRRLGSPGWKTRFLFDCRLRQLTENDVAIDCGANVGVFTEMIAATGALVHAFEPDPYAFARLSERTAALPNVVLHNVAVGTSEATVRLYRTEDFDSRPDNACISSSLYADKINIDRGNYIEVRQIDFPAFLSSLSARVAILKIDIEGAEVLLLERMIADGTIDVCDFVFVETHETRIPALAKRTAALHDVAGSPRFADKLFLDWE